MSDVKVTYNSDKPAQLQANAYASGNDIHIAPGQEKSLPHEAWHVVQQKQNRVKPTIKTDSGELINDDPALEKEADVMGEKALQLKSNTRENLSKSSTKNSVAQLDKTSKNADFSAASGVKDEESGSKTANIDADAIKAQQAARVADKPKEEAAKSDKQKSKEKKQNEEE